VLLVLLVFFLPRGIVAHFGRGLDGTLRGLPQDRLRRRSRRSDRNRDSSQ
jgi:hypothetical protein